MHADAHLRDEKTELVDAVSDLAEGAVLEVCNGLGHVSDERVDILDASVKVFDFLNFECTNKETVDQLGDLEGRYALKRGVAFRRTLACIHTAANLGVGLSGEKSESEIFHALKN